MNIRDELLKEKNHTKQHALQIAEYAVSSSRHFKELMKCFLDKEYRVAQRAAWSVSWAARKKPAMMLPYIKDLVDQLKGNAVHAAVVRNTVRILEAIDIPEAYHGEVMDCCFKLVEEPTTAVAIKAFSLTALFNLSKQYPEIKPELKLVIEERKDNETAAFKVRANKILKAL